ncbi:LPS assembly lipoprotein LptE [Sulfurovum sp. zt1-1]|uniref:LPS assembly lipoprotein LptE n=1 Tax=Sulfurovum zhangzhouensis TaxID=3019067 RepID=A0ABT7QWW1_9BACT|nr:LPS assembly lipoprotein LptE [Sulfurovum zhangzhouensis]MDM5271322.1 LPS assembly lipoprotein LptE [Sulfurovum zhangzhouensis]
MSRGTKDFFQKSILMPLFAILSMLLISGCGYKPSTQAIKNSFSENVSIEVIVDRVEPENAPFIKDEMNRMIYTRFKGRVVPKAMAQNHIRITYDGSTFTPLSYEDGYVTRYQVNLNVKFEMVTKQGKESKTIHTIDEADIHASSLDASTLRIEAIRRALAKALDEFLAYVSAKGTYSTKDSKD